MLLLALALLSLHCSTLAQITQHPLKYANSTILDPAMDSFIEGVISSWNSPGGASVAVVKQHEDGSWQVETKGYGIAKVAEGKKLDADSLFYIASNSKVCTVLLLC
jgi:CubicO group peptidase (beta-lactamase class C family)